MNRTVYEDRYFEVVSPEFPLNCRDDGGHLVLLKKEKVTDRSDMTYQEAIAFMRASMIIAQVGMWAVLHEIRSEYAQLLTVLFLGINGPCIWSLDGLIRKPKRQRVGAARLPTAMLRPETSRSREVSSAVGA